MHHQILTIIAAAGLAVSPAAANPMDLGGGERELGLFAGGSLRLPFQPNTGPTPQARLQLTAAEAYARPGSAPVISYHRQRGLELGFASNKPSLLIGGHESSTIKRKLGVEGGSTPVGILGGLVVAGGLLLIASEIFDNKADAEPLQHIPQQSGGRRSEVSRQEYSWPLGSRARETG